MSLGYQKPSFTAVSVASTIAPRENIPDKLLLSPDAAGVCGDGRLLFCAPSSAATLGIVPSICLSKGLFVSTASLRFCTNLLASLRLAGVSGSGGSELTVLV